MLLSLLALSSLGKLSLPVGTQRVTPHTQTSQWSLRFNSVHPRRKNQDAICHFKQHSTHEPFHIQFPYQIHRHVSHAIVPFPNGLCSENCKQDLSSCPWHSQLFEIAFPGQIPFFDGYNTPCPLQNPGLTRPSPLLIPECQGTMVMSPLGDSVGPTGFLWR